MVIAEPKQSPLVRMEIVTDPALRAEGGEQFEQYMLNSDWLRAHASEAYSNRGKFICIAGQELFVADTAKQAKEKGQKAHPNDEGIFVRFVPTKKTVWIYAHRR